MKLTGGILGWGGERLGGVHGSLVGYVKLRGHMFCCVLYQGGPHLTSFSSWSSLSSSSLLDIVPYPLLAPSTT